MLSKIRLITDNLTPQLTQATVLAAIILLLSFAPAPADTLHATDDSYIDLVLTGENFGGNPNLVVQNVDIGRRGGENWTLVRFDLSTLPGGISSVDVDKASVRLWVSRVFVGGVVDVHVVTAPWDEGSVTGGPPPGFDPVPFVSIPIASANEGKFVTADVTGLVKGWLDGGATLASSFGRMRPVSAFNWTARRILRPATRRKSRSG